MLRIIAILFGIIFIFVGVAGFLPAFTTNDLLFGYFLVDFVHNIVHIASGVIAIMAATSYFYTRLYFQVFGVIYAIVTLLGFVLQGDLILLHVNMADNFLHLAIAVVALLLGFATAKYRDI